ncbi:MAG: RNA polymerase sigma factor [Desulfobacterales bacterium]|nr:RNA polymerase sigma factor [Desulfobacterales bacterium]
MSEHHNNGYPSPCGAGKALEAQTVLLAQKAVSGNFHAINQLADLYYSKIFRMVYYRIRCMMDAEDLTQEIFTQAFRNINSLKDIEKFKSWLFSIAINKVKDFKRKKQFVSLFGILSDSNIKDEQETDTEPDSRPDENPLYNVMRHNFWKQFEDVLSRFSNLEKEVFLLRFLDHLGINEIAVALDKNESTVKTHLYRALKKLKDDDSVKKLLKESLP